MSLADLEPVERARQEAAMPPIWLSGVHSPARIDWYTRLVIDSGLVRGGVLVIPELVAAMILESSLDNLIVGNNAKNGRPAGHPAFGSLGVSWVQLDTLYHVGTLAELHDYRSDPLVPLGYVTDPENGLCSQGGYATHFRREFWNAWRTDRLDPVDGWNPLRAAHEAWGRVTGGGA